MRVVIKPTYEDLSSWAADYVVYRINKHRPTPKKPFVLGLPSGSTPLGMFNVLAKYYKEGKMSYFSAPANMSASAPAMNAAFSMPCGINF